MRNRNLATAIVLLFSFTAFSQTAFRYQPEHPKAGDVITFTYEPAGAIAGTQKPVEAAAYFLGRAQSADDIALTRNGKSYSGRIKTDTSQNFVYLGFSSNKQCDNNAGEGYYILLTDGAAVKKGAFVNLAQFYQYVGSRVGVASDNAKALTAFEKELKAYPASRKENMVQYAYLISSAKKGEAQPLILKEIETLLSDSLTKEEDYTTLATLYGVARLPHQSELISTIQREKFPAGNWRIDKAIQAFYMEQDPAKAQQLLADMQEKVKSDAAWKQREGQLEYFKSQMLNLYARKSDWAGLKKALATTALKDKTQQASLYNNLAWAMQQDSSADLKYAEELSRFATQYAKSELKKPSGKKPEYATPKDWVQQRTDAYTMYGDTYAMVLYRMGDYKAAYKQAKEAAITLGGGKEINKLNTYALIAENVLPPKQYKQELEGFVKEGLISSAISAGLKRAYAKEKGSEAGFKAYMTGLQTEAIAKRMAELKKSMLHETAPSFTLLDLNGNQISTADLKGKVVVVDFWATWCGPCKASFPGMQKMVTKYKDNPVVKFVFVDTWERGEEKKKGAADFITANKYDFQVLLDDDNKVVEQFGVDGIPTKLILDKDGFIRFKALGFDGSDEKLISELTAMIEIASAPVPQKAF